MFRRPKQPEYSSELLKRKTILFSILAGAIALPWPWLLHKFFDFRVFGQDIGFFTVLIVVPAILALLLTQYCSSADDHERHLRKYENE